MNLVDSKYIGLVSSRLQKFKKVKTDLYNFRCPICGDSKKTQSKTRGYLYAVKADINFRCHNCGASMTFSSFLKTIDPVAHKQYIFERFKQGSTGRGTVVEEPEFKFQPPKFKPKINLPKASENPRASDYLKKRKINPINFYYTGKFKAWTNTQKKTFDNTDKDHARIIIPLFYEDTLIGFQGRSLDPWIQPKYLTIMFHDESPKIYGLDTVRKSSPVFVTEGPFDRHSYAIRLLCVVQTVMLGSGVLALLFGFMITNQGLKKLRQESPAPLLEVNPSLSSPVILKKKI